MRQVGRHHERPVDAEAAADPRQEERGRAADRADDGADREERDEALAVVVALAVAAEDRDPVDREAAEQHPEVLDVRLGAALQQAPGDRDPGRVTRRGAERPSLRPRRPGIRASNPDLAGRL